MLGSACEGEDLPPLFYSAKLIQGTVVDAATGQPLAGVIVVAQWVQSVAPAGTPHRLQVFETVTDAQGRYRFPAWGPKLNTRFPLGSFDFRAPALDFFLTGYGPDGRANEYPPREALLPSYWDGKTIQLKRFTGTDEQWAQTLSFLQTRLDWAPGMDWRRVPRITLALEVQHLRLSGSAIAKRGLNISGLYALGTTIDEVRKFPGDQK